MNIRHIAIIMDGNGRWARKRGLSRIEGHRNGVKRVNEMIDASIEHGLKAITFYTFSMENWQRPDAEVNALMSILAAYLKSEMKRLHKKNVVFRAIGDIGKLPSKVRKLIKDFTELTKNNTGVIVTSALSYGGRAEIVNAVKDLIEKNVHAEDVDEQMLESLELSL